MAWAPVRGEGEDETTPRVICGRLRKAEVHTPYDGLERSETGGPELGYLAVDRGDIVEFRCGPYHGHTRNRFTTYMYVRRHGDGRMGWVPRETLIFFVEPYELGLAPEPKEFDPWFPARQQIRDRHPRDTAPQAPATL